MCLCSVQKLQCPVSRWIVKVDRFSLDRMSFPSVVVHHVCLSRVVSGCRSRLWLRKSPRPRVTAFLRRRSRQTRRESPRQQPNGWYLRNSDGVWWASSTRQEKQKVTLVPWTAELAQKTVCGLHRKWKVHLIFRKIV